MGGSGSKAAGKVAPTTKGKAKAKAKASPVTMGDAKANMASGIESIEQAVESVGAAVDVLSASLDEAMVGLNEAAEAGDPVSAAALGEEPVDPKAKASKGKGKGKAKGGKITVSGSKLAEGLNAMERIAESLTARPPSSALIAVTKANARSEYRRLTEAQQREVLEGCGMDEDDIEEALEDGDDLEELGEEYSTATIAREINRLRPVWQDANNEPAETTATNDPRMVAIAASVAASRQAGASDSAMRNAAAVAAEAATAEAVSLGIPGAVRYDAMTRASLQRLAREREWASAHVVAKYGTAYMRNRALREDVTTLVNTILDGGPVTASTKTPGQRRAEMIGEVDISGVTKYAATGSWSLNNAMLRLGLASTRSEADRLSSNTRKQRLREAEFRIEAQRESPDYSKFGNGTLRRLLGLREITPLTWSRSNMLVALRDAQAEFGPIPLPGETARPVERLQDALTAEVLAAIAERGWTFHTEIASYYSSTFGQTVLDRLNTVVDANLGGDPMMAVQLVRTDATGIHPVVDEAGLRDAIRWISSNNSNYGVGFYNFTPFKGAKKSSVGPQPIPEGFFDPNPNAAPGFIARFDVRRREWVGVLPVTALVEDADLKDVQGATKVLKKINAKKASKGKANPSSPGALPRAKTLIIDFQGVPLGRKSGRGSMSMQYVRDIAMFHARSYTGNPRVIVKNLRLAPDMQPLPGELLVDRLVQDKRGGWTGIANYHGWEAVVTTSDINSIAEFFEVRNPITRELYARVWAGKFASATEASLRTVSEELESLQQRRMALSKRVGELTLMHRLLQTDGSRALNQAIGGIEHIAGIEKVRFDPSGITLTTEDIWYSPPGGKEEGRRWMGRYRFYIDPIGNSIAIQNLALSKFEQPSVTTQSGRTGSICLGGYPDLISNGFKSMDYEVIAMTLLEFVRDGHLGDGLGASNYRTHFSKTKPEAPIVGGIYQFYGSPNTVSLSETEADDDDDADAELEVSVDSDSDW